MSTNIYVYIFNIPSLSGSRGKTDRHYQSPRQIEGQIVPLEKITDSRIRSHRRVIFAVTVIETLSIFYCLYFYFFIVYIFQGQVRTTG